MALTEEQSLVFTYYFQGGHELRTLIAPAGCGKTFVIKAISESLQIRVICPTHKAASIFKRDSIGATTIHCFLSSEIQYDEDGKEYYDFNIKKAVDKLTKIYHNRATKSRLGKKTDMALWTEKNTLSMYLDLIVVDECSMLDEKIVKHLLEFSKETNIPMLFSGDDCQLPPIKETKSKIFEIDHFPFKLTKNMRSQEADDYKYVLAARDRVLHPGKGYFNIPKIDNDQVVDMFVRKYYEDSDDSDDDDDDIVVDEVDYGKKIQTVILSYTNRRKNYFNQLIRQNLFGTIGNRLEKVYPDELFIFQGYYCRMEKKKNNDGSIWYDYITYHTSDVIKIKSVRQIVKQVDYKPLNCMHNNTPSHNCVIPSCSLCGLLAHKTKGFSIKFYHCVDHKKTEWFIPYTTEDEKLVDEILHHWKSYLKQTYKKRLLTGKKEEDPLWKEERKRAWAEYKDFETTHKPPLSYIYAITIHQSQGSEWKHVFVDWSSIQYCKIEQSLKDKLIYTAFSRMRETLTVIR